MQNLGYYNGQIGPLAEMQVPMNDRACWFGDGVYDAAIARNGVIFANQDHIDRFFSSAALVDIQIPVSKQELSDLLYELLAKMESPEVFVYYQCSRGTAIRDHVYTPGPGNLWITMKPVKSKDSLDPVHLISAPDIRNLCCNIKTINLLPAVLSSQLAKNASAAECVLYREGEGGGRVTECAHSNVHILKDGVFRTAPADNLILNGIARQHLIANCHKLGIPVVEEAFSMDELRDADEVIVSSTSKISMRAGWLDGEPVGCKDPELYTRLHQAAFGEYYEATRG